MQAQRVTGHVQMATGGYGQHEDGNSYAAGDELEAAQLCIAVRS